MPAPYSKPSQQLIWDLINKSNPQLQIPLSDLNCVIYGYPTAQAPAVANGMRNTRIRLYAKQGMGYKGELIVNYNRLNLASLFVGITATVVNYTANDWKSVISAFNATYGLSLIQSNRNSNISPDPWALGMTIPDISPAQTFSSGSDGNDNSRVFYATPESLCWTGAVSITRIRGNPDLGTLITKPALADSRRVVPSVDGKYNVPLLTYGYDFTDYQADINAFINAPTNQSLKNRIAQILTAVTGLPFTWSTASNTANSLPLDLFTMNNAVRGGTPGVREYFNSEDYNRCIILYTASPYGTAWDPFSYGLLQQDQDTPPVNPLQVGVFMHYNL